MISIHALRVEGDLHLLEFLKHLVKFLSTPSGWRATAQFTLTSSTGVISIHALRVEGDHLLCGGHIIFGISIHALRVEGDFCLSFQIVFVIIFLSTPSGWRATAIQQCELCTAFNFYPRPPGGGRPLCSYSPCQLSSDFYPRPPGGGRHRCGIIKCKDKKFLSTPSGWRATLCVIIALQ